MALLKAVTETKTAEWGFVASLGAEAEQVLAASHLVASGGGPVHVCLPQYTRDCGQHLGFACEAASLGICFVG